MGLTKIKVEVLNPGNPKRSKALEFLVDSGAAYSVVPKGVLKGLGIKPVAEHTFRLADGSSIVRKKGFAVFKYHDKIGGGDVVFGEEGDSVLLGVLTLESMGLGLNPLKRELIDIPMIIA